jgi:hypothetical protein
VEHRSAIQLTGIKQKTTSEEVVLENELNIVNEKLKKMRFESSVLPVISAIVACLQFYS